MNFPNANNLILRNGYIAVTDLIYLENKLFSLKMKLKVLFIPSDFIFISTLKSAVVEVNEEYDEDDIFILRQYKTNQDSPKLQFQSIARGPDLGYSYMKVYPSYKTFNEEFEYKGRKGEITLDFRGQCLDDYHYLNNSDLNLCTNLKPENYYLDNDDNTYKPCPYGCNECDKPVNETIMNCKACIPNYFMTIDTNSCYTGEID